jgi:hypothetical protein
MFLFYKYTMTLVLFFLIPLSAYMGYRQIQVTANPLSFFHKLKKSILFGFFLTLLMLSFFGSFGFFLWDGSDTEMEGVYSLIPCIAIPMLTIGSIGGYIRISYYEFLVHRGK